MRNKSAIFVKFLKIRKQVAANLAMGAGSQEDVSIFAGFSSLMAFVFKHNPYARVRFPFMADYIRFLKCSEIALNGTLGHRQGFRHGLARNEWIRFDDRYYNSLSLS